MNKHRIPGAILLLVFLCAPLGCRKTSSAPTSPIRLSEHTNIVFWLDTGLLDEERQGAGNSVFEEAKKECERLTTECTTVEKQPYLSVITPHGHGQGIHVPGYWTPREVCNHLQAEFLADSDKAVCGCQRDIGEALLRSLGELEKMREYRVRNLAGGLRSVPKQKGLIVAWFGGPNMAIAESQGQNSATEFERKWEAMSQFHDLKLVLVLPPGLSTDALPEPLGSFLDRLQKQDQLLLAETCAYANGNCMVARNKTSAFALLEAKLAAQWNRLESPTDAQGAPDTGNMKDIVTDVADVPAADASDPDVASPSPDVVEVVDAAPEILVKDVIEAEVPPDVLDAVEESPDTQDAVPQPELPPALAHFILLDRSKSVPQESLTDLLGRVTGRIGCFVQPQDRVIFVPFATDYKPSCVSRGFEMEQHTARVVDVLARDKTCLHAALAWCFGGQAEALLVEGDAPLEWPAGSPPCVLPGGDVAVRTLDDQMERLRTDQGRALWVYSDFKDDPAADLERNLKAALRERRRDRPHLVIPLLATPTARRNLTRFEKALDNELPILNEDTRLLLPE